jgi:hypothetical protein
MDTFFVGNPLAWSRDFGIVGALTGSLAPFFVIFDASFALAGGMVGGFLGVLLGLVAAVGVEVGRRQVPLPVFVAAIAVLGAVQGAIAGFAGGMTETLTMGVEAAPLGFIVGSTSGMVALPVFFAPYLVLSVRRWPTWPAVFGAAMLAPLMGWAGLAALGFSTFGLWLFALPLLLWAGIAMDRSMRARVGSAERTGDPVPTMESQAVHRSRRVRYAHARQ